MAYLLLILFVVVTAIPWIVRTSPRILHPLNVFVIMQLLLIVPGVLVALSDHEAMDARIVNAAGGNFGSAMAWTLGLLTLMNLCIYAAFYFWRARQPVAPRDYAPLAEQAYDSYVYVGLLMGLMLLAFILKAWFAGGFDFFLSNLSNRAELQRGTGPFLILEQGCRILGLFVATRVALIRDNPFSWTSLAAVVALSFIVGGMFGSRKSAIDTLVLVAMTISFYRPHFFLASPRNVVAVLAGYLAILFLLFVGLIYRNSDAQIDMSYVLFTSWFDIKEMVVTNSYIGTYYFITNVYDAGSYYYWSLLGDLKTAFLPSAIFEDKAIADDGVYVKYAVQGVFLPPQTPVLLVVTDSMPPETLGGAYLNGGPFAVPFYGLILGSVFAFFLTRAERYPNAPAWVILAFWVFTTFEVSNLRFSQLVTLAVALVLVRLAAKPLEVASVARLRSV